jgi:4-carboxymuconolactone decarboxylase
MSEKFVTGMKVVEEMLGETVVGALKASLNSTRFGAQRGPLAVEFVFGELWARPGLDRRARSLVTLGILIALGQVDELKIHVVAAIRNGCTVEEIDEALMHSTAYAGFPRAGQATTAAAEALRAQGLIGN